MEFLEYDWRSPLGSDKLVLEGRAKKQDPGARHAALQTLRELVGASLDLALRDKSRCQDDRFLDMFLYARKHDVQEAFQLLINYYSYRQKNPAIFRDLTAEDPLVARALAEGLPGVLRERDRRGRCVFIMFASNWAPHYLPLVSVYRALILSLEKALEELQNQANGFVIVVDWTEFTFKQTSNMNPKLLKLMIEGLQDCFPARFKGIHFIAQPWYVETALTVIKPFLRGKTKERIYVHGNNLSTLHEYLTRDILPSDLGGEGPSHSTEPWLARLLPPPPPLLMAPPARVLTKDEAPRPDDCNEIRHDDYFESAKIDKGYKKSNGFCFMNNNGMEKSAKTQLLNCEEDI